MTSRDLSEALTPAPPGRWSRVLRSPAGLVGLGVLLLMVVACVGSLPWTLGAAAGDVPRYKAGSLDAYLLPPDWAAHRADESARRSQFAATETAAARRAPSFPLGSDKLGRDLFTRCLAGGGVSIGIGLAAATISVGIGVLWGSIAGAVGGRVDALMMRIVDVLYGLPYILLVVLLAVAGEAVLDNVVSRHGARDAWMLERARELAAAQSRPADPPSLRAWMRSDQAVQAELSRAADQVPELRARELNEGERTVYEVGVLLLAVGGVSWLTMSRVIRGQVLSLKSQPFMEAARAMGVPAWRQFVRHLLPNLAAPIIVYATLTVPQAILQESFLSFLGIGVKPPLPSWGNLAAEGLAELNPVRVRWWLLVFPCVLLAVTLLALNFVGESLREAFDPRSRRR